MIDIKYNDFYLLITSQLARHWADLSSKQFIKATALLFSQDHYETSIKLRMLKVVLNAHYFKFWLRIKLNSLYDWQVLELAETFSWLFNQDSCCEGNLIPSFKLKGQLYTGPEEILTVISWGDFRNTCDYFSLFIKYDDTKYLDKGVALLYKPFDIEDDNASFVARSNLFSKLKTDIKLAIFFNFVMMQNELAPLFPHVFKKPEKKKPKTKSQKPTKLQLWNNFMGEWLEWKVEDYHKKDDLNMLVVLESLDKIIEHGKKKPKQKKK